MIKKYSKKVLVIVLLLAIILSSSTAIASASSTGSWRSNNVGWWYETTDRTYPASQWSKINNKWYYFNSRGYMETGWIKSYNSWYYLGKSGAMWTNSWVGGKYYVDIYGVMLANTWTPDDYYVSANGSWNRSTGRTLAKNLNIEGINSPSYSYYNYAYPDKIHYYVDNNQNINLVSYMGSNKVTINTYDKNYKLLRERSFQIPFNIWGGFHHGEDGNFYIVCGRSNYELSLNKSVVKILKYSSDWKLLGSTDILGSASNYFQGIQMPFDAGNCRMDLKDDVLTIHMSRTMFPASDGLSHQGNISFLINTKTMKEIEGVSIPYASHSFNQFVKHDRDYIMYLDHGDAYPRSIVATIIGKDGNEDSRDLFELRGVTGDNYTGTTLNGFELGSDNNIAVGKSRPHYNPVNGIVGNARSLANNIYAIVIDKNLNDSKFIWITNHHPRDTSIEVSEPRLIKISESEFAIIFSEEKDGVDTLQYRLIDDNGNILSSHSYKGMYFPASSDPIIVEDKIIWLGAEKNDYHSQSNYFYSISIK